MRKTARSFSLSLSLIRLACVCVCVCVSQCMCRCKTTSEFRTSDACTHVCVCGCTHIFVHTFERAVAPFHADGASQLRAGRGSELSDEIILCFLRVECTRPTCFNNIHNICDATRRRKGDGEFAQQTLRVFAAHQHRSIAPVRCSHACGDRPSWGYKGACARHQGNANTNTDSDWMRLWRILSKFAITMTLTFLHLVDGVSLGCYVSMNCYLNDNMLPILAIL